MRAVALLLVLAGCASFQGAPLPREAERHRARTSDGWEVSMTRYRAVGAAKGLPVLLVHGIAANERNMDLDAQHSMARWFAAQGREAWTLSLRGTGQSDRAAGGRAPITFDAYWRFDLPAAIALIRQVSGAEAIDYAGHSMGGMVLYAYLAEGGQGIHAGATLGSPTRLDWGTGLELLLKKAGPALVKKDSTIPSLLGAHAAAPIQGLVDDGPFQRFFYNPQSTDLETWRRLMVWGTADVAGGTALQLIELMQTGRFLSEDGVDLKADMAKITTPVLVVAARLDRIAVAPAVKDGYRALGGPKEWVLITRANGAGGEYGHMDLVIGERAGVEVWPKLVDFFSRVPRVYPRTPRGP